MIEQLAELLVYDFVTQIDDRASGRVVVAASHGGKFSVQLALGIGVGALIVCDAGVGLENAGIAGLLYAEEYGTPCAAVDFQSARIGDGADCVLRGRIAFANMPARELGIHSGMWVKDAARMLQMGCVCPVSTGHEIGQEARFVLESEGSRRLVLIDSASLVEPGDVGAIVITGSHGGLLGGRHETAIKQQVFAALYNDAGIGRDSAGISRLPALDARGIAGATVFASSARIGDARSTLESGVISRVNHVAYGYGAREGFTARQWRDVMIHASNR